MTLWAALRPQRAADHHNENSPKNGAANDYWAAVARNEARGIGRRELRKWTLARLLEKANHFSLEYDVSLMLADPSAGIFSATKTETPKCAKVGSVPSDVRAGNWGLKTTEFSN